MAVEIEHKYLVEGEYKSLAISVAHITQGYISSDVAHTVRVRIMDEQAFLTIKGPSSQNGLKRYEFEKKIELNEAHQLLELCESGIVEKYRYLIPFGTHTCEVDEFFGDNEGLVMAEVEVDSEEETFEKPSFLGKEVTGDKRFYNSQLRKHPYKEWRER